MTPTWLEISGVIGLIIFFGIVVMSGFGREDGRLSFRKLLLLMVIPSGVASFIAIQAAQERNPGGYKSKDQLRAEKLFSENCKQIDFIQGEFKTATGFGVSVTGSPVVGTINQNSADRYTYLCDKGVRYTLTYDIEKYRNK